MKKVLVYVEWKAEPRIWKVRCNPGAPDWAKEMIEEELRHKNTLVSRARENCKRVAGKGERVELYIKKRNRELGAKAYAVTIYKGAADAS
jgi:hypothetical protein